MTDYNVSRNAADAPSETSDFFDEVKNGRDENTEVPGGYGSYPHIYVVEVGDEVFYGFGTELPEDREPWIVGFRPVTRDSVINAETFEDVNGAKATLVNALVTLEREDDLSTEQIETLLSAVADSL